MEEPDGPEERGTAGDSAPPPAGPRTPPAAYTDDEDESESHIIRGVD